MRLLLAAILVSLAATSAAADRSPPRDVGKMVTDDCARARKAKKDCVLTMESHEVTGGKPVGDGTVVTVPTSTRHPSLIQHRADFIPEILKSAEDL